MCIRDRTEADLARHAWCLDRVRKSAKDRSRSCETCMVFGQSEKVGERQKPLFVKVRWIKLWEHTMVLGQSEKVGERQKPLFVKVRWIKLWEHTMVFGQSEKVGERQKPLFVKVRWILRDIHGVKTVRKSAKDRSRCL